MFRGIIRGVALAGIAVLAVSLGCDGSGAPAADPAAAADAAEKIGRYEAGQVWSYRTRAGEEGSTLLILSAERHPSVGPVVHVMVRGLRLADPEAADGIQEAVGFVPLSLAALDASVLELLESGQPRPDFANHHARWTQWAEEGKGGAFESSVAGLVADFGPVVPEP